jgi:tetratricopeptide (TPR) repeat protein
MGFFTILLILSSGCIGKRDGYGKMKRDKKCVSLNDSGVLKLESFYQYRDSLYLDESEFLFSKAIECDSSYFLAYANLQAVLLLRKKYEKVLDIYSVMSLYVLDDPDLYAQRGILLQYLGRSEEADIDFEKAFYYYNREISDNPASTELYLGKYVLIAVLQGKEFAIKELANDKVGADVKEEVSIVLLQFNKDLFLKSSLRL